MMQGFAGFEILFEYLRGQIGLGGRGPWLPKSVGTSSYVGEKLLILPRFQTQLSSFLKLKVQICARFMRIYQYNSSLLYFVS
jgi:hypothetical protein